MLTIGICGNHRVQYCTESELDWTLRQMGHKVFTFQENVVKTHLMVRACLTNNIQLFLYLHTHHWTSPGTLTMDQVLSQLRQQGIKTASFHLDRFWGLNRADKREDQIGVHPFWRTDAVFTADGGHQAEFAARGVNHHWLPPAVAARHCWRGTYRPELAQDVVFVGARRYHPEYPFRMTLIDWLTKTYGSRFRRFGGDAVGGVVREEKLNDVYASAGVVVGDSCFAGSPYYWSDRVPETLGRGGFLIHPQTPGLSIEGMVEFQPENLTELKACIDHWVTRKEERFTRTEAAMAVVRQAHTYTQRMATVLNILGLSSASDTHTRPTPVPAV